MRWQTAMLGVLALAAWLGGGVGAAAGAALPKADLRPAGAQGEARVLTFETTRRLDANQINMFVWNNGTYAFLGSTPTNVNLLGGLVYPRGTAKTVVFGSGIWLGCKIDGETHTAIGTYSSDFAPGAIVEGTFDDPTKPEYRVYKVVRFAGDPQDTAHVERSSKELGDDPALDALAHDSWSEYMAGAASHGAPWRWYRLADTATPDPGDSVDVPGPDVVGDQMLWAVYNDDNPAYHIAVPSNPMPLGVEIQQTSFAFNRQGPLGSTVFVSFKIINKGANRLEDAYVSLWSDPDLGVGGDDLVGCDTSLSLGYVYNATNNDQVYGAKPPAVGYDFFLGPVDRASGDTLRLASFNKILNGTDPTIVPEIYNYMRGLDLRGNPVVDPISGQQTPYFHAGDPVTGKGWLDSSPGDRRFLMSSGPFVMEPGDTQIVVGGIVVGQGSDRLSSISALRFDDLFAQDAFDRDFVLPSPPAAPKVSVAVDHGQVVLSWDSASRLSYHQAGYTFEGYNVYQGESVAGPWVRIATYDEIDQVRVIFDQVFDPVTGQLIVQYPVAYGSDAGVQYSHEVTQDAVRGGVLRDGTEYYFAVTAYSYGPEERTKVLENAQSAIRVMPQRPPLGTDPGTATALPIDYVQADPTRVPTTDQIVAEVLDPAQITGHSYEVTFTPLDPPLFGFVGADTATVLSAWNLRDLTTGQMLLSGQLNRRGDGDYQVLDGLRVKEVGDYFPLLKDAVYEDNNPARVAPWGADALPLFFGGAGTAADFSEVATTLYPAVQVDSFVPVEIRFSSQATQKAYRFLRLELGQACGSSNPGDSLATGWGYPYGGFRDCSFTVWDLSHDVQLDAAFVERTLVDCDGTILPSDQQPVTFDSTWAPGLDGGGNEYLLVLRRPYDGTAKPEVTRDGALRDGSLPLLYALVLQVPAPADCNCTAGIDDGDAFRFSWVVPASPNDTMRFATHPLVRDDASLARSNLDKIRVVPNPYYNQSRYELSSVVRIVRFINMPEQGTVRIFNLAGQLVRTLQKTDPTISVLEWNLQNENGLPVASGVYIYHVEVPGVGSAVGRMVVFMEQEQLLNY